MTETTNKATVTVYSTPWCAFCRTEKQWLESLGVSFISRDIEEDESAKEELLDKLGGQFQGVPTTIIGDKIVIGFDRPKLQAVLAANKLVEP